MPSFAQRMVGQKQDHHLLQFYASSEKREASVCLVLQQSAQVYPIWDILGVSYPNLGGYTSYLYICRFYQLVMGPFSDCVFCCSLHLVTACLQADGLAFLARRTTCAVFHTVPSCLLFLAVKEFACWGREMCLEKGVLIRLQESWEQTSNIIG